MKTATELKHFFRDKLGVKGVRVRTMPGRGLWQAVWLSYSDPQTIPLAFRIMCLKIVYPNSPSCWSGTAGNVSGHSISLHQHEWEQALAEWNNQGLTATAPVVN
jgi:hypothetical protein